MLRMAVETTLWEREVKMFLLATQKRRTFSNNVAFLLLSGKTSFSAKARLSNLLYCGSRGDFRDIARNGGGNTQRNSPPVENEANAFPTFIDGFIMRRSRKKRRNLIGLSIRAMLSDCTRSAR